MRLAIVTLGHVHAEDLAPLTTRFEHLEQLVLDIDPRADLAAHRAEFNRALDAASTDWVLVVREREKIDDALADEIVDAMRASKAWGFRIRSIPYYAGKPLRLGRVDGELRLMQRRHVLRRGELAVQGTVVRFSSAFRSVTFASYEEHHEHLAKRGTRRSPLLRALHFVRYFLGTRTFDRNTLRYLWIEAGFEVDRNAVTA
ncbi:MAG TPA: hypothetical protein VHK90_18645 [Thermoanaerobaculia bacterium]|nr:hypothetical protein [Thermoanaerobaculia bacterium]